MATYYINPDATYNGDGTLPTEATGAGQPGAYNAMPSISANNTYLFKRGASPLTAATITLVANVIFAAYYNDDGTDDIIQSKPIITNNNAGNTLAIVSDGSVGVRLYNLEVRGGTAASSRTLYIRPSTITDTITDIDFEATDCIFSTGYQNTLRILASNARFYNCDISGGGTATEDTVHAECDNLKFINCNLHNVGTSDMLQATPGSGNALVEGWEIRGCNFIGAINNYGCLTFTGASAVLPSIIEYNTFKYGNIVANLKADYMVFRNNLVISGSNTASTTSRTVGIEADYVKCYGNVIIDTNETAPTAQYGCLWVNASTGSEIYNNTIIGSNYNDAQYDGVSIHQTNTYNAIVRNNIIINFYNNLRIRTGMGHIEANNCLHNPINQNYVDESGTATPTDSIEVDPELDSQYRLKAGSSCIGAGITPLSIRDNEGRYPAGGSYDIGAKWFYAHEDSTISMVLASGGVI